MRRRALLVALATLLVSPSAHAQSDRPTADSFRIEWTRRPGWMRPGTDAYLYNDSRWRLTNVRVRAQVVDGSGRVLRESTVSVFGNSVPRTRTFFVLPPLADGESFQLAVASFDLVAQEPAQESP
jgi:hypothetical protein